VTASPRYTREPTARRRQREVLVLRFFADLTVEQTATALGCSTGTVKSYTSRALARLRDVLTGDDNETEEVPHAH
jgi:DNA-directed RNA polymerase specialized sigma24 family protein